MNEQVNLSPSISILFVCLGNICRSPAAEGVMRALTSAANMPESIHIESAGTGGYHDGKLPDSRMRGAAKKRGYPLDSRAQTIALKDFERFDLIIAMDRDNVQAIHRVGNPIPGQLKLLSDYLGNDWPTDVPDPYYGGEDGFEYVLDMLEAACPKILEEIQREFRAR
ncbi:MAG: low molecular weight phosphotyrosine protein phosphatase [Planctomycetota bacterium]|nr:low molecular weight phosphotyrosine protein phosphatase [Planctomycetota bacterium]